MPTSILPLLLAQVHAATTPEMETIGPVTLSKTHWGLIFHAGSAVITVVGAMILVRLVPLLERLVHRVAARNESSRDATASTVDRRHHFETLAKVTTSIAMAVIWTMTVIMVLGDLGIAVAPLLATAGVAGVAIGFGAQSIVKDFFGGFFILLENQFDVGDTVILGGVTGTVERMTMRITVLRDANGTVYFFPNSAITSVANKTYGWARTVVETTFAATVSESEVHDLLTAAANRAAEGLRADHLLAEDGVTVEGPVDYIAGRTTWRLVAKVRAESVSRARGILISALAADVRSRRYSGVDGVLSRVDTGV